MDLAPVSNLLKTGASATAMVPGWGMAASAGMGALSFGLDLIQANQEKKKAEEAARQAELERQRKEQSLRAQNYRQVMTTFPSQGVATPSLYAKGGSLIPPAYIAEGEEVVEHSPMDVLMTDANGETNRLSSNMTKLEGDKHSAPSGGIGVNQSGGGFVFSDQIVVPQDLVQRFKNARL